VVSGGYIWGVMSAVEETTCNTHRAHFQKMDSECNYGREVFACFVIKTTWKNKPLLAAAWKKEERVTRVRGRPYNKSIILFPKAKEKSCHNAMYLYGDARRISAVKYKLFFP
jgi:hypothetical protein